MTRTLICLLLIATPALAQNAGDAARGKELFLRDACYTCHGTTGAGGGALGGPRLAHAGLTPNAIINELRHPRAAMPAYSEKILSDSEADDLVAFIQSLSRESAPDAKKIPLLNPP
ncbi:MAG TPA: cytochrome c [Rhizomicrobium sp.]|nr:cytochrome c [Rhizomicrobium sp.]